MAAHRTLSSLLVVAVMLAAVIQDGGVVQSRSVDGLGRLEKLLASLSGSAGSSDTSALAGPLTPVRSAGSMAFLPEHSMDKRQAFDRSCKGVYDRGLFKKLERVCDDCYNLYRKPYVEVGCKANCYANSIFRQCIGDLLLEDVVEEYAQAIQMVGK
uniref:Prepro-crustacean hyperglycemic hormone n=1 Tax=Pagurus bernhardus TaxID=174397 RepID=A0SIT0_PAGBR|nr:prepro-crustacean hyperglycemic hormone [Pagurus bernhardus]